MPLIATKGAASAQGFGEFAQTTEPVYIEQIFSTYLYTGNGSTQTITNNIDLSTKGGMVWIKSRSNATSNVVFDTVRGVYKFVATDTTNSQDTINDTLTAFNTTGFSLGSDALDGKVNTSSRTYASWTFRKQPKFFDVVTYTGDGVSGRKVSHNLGSVPGAIFVKATSATSDWCCMVRASDTTYASFLSLNTTGASAYTGVLGDPPTSTEFTTNSLGNSAGTYTPNVNGVTYVAYFFAHNAGGFGLAGDQNVITCGSVVGSSNVEVNLGWEPQWLLVKNASAAQDWWVVDNMRGLPVQGASNAYNASALRPNTSDAETTGFAIAPSATGFKANVLTASQTYIYIAIRRGPMKTPTTGTSVFTPVAYTGNGSTRSYSVGFPTDLSINMTRSFAGDAPTWNDRLRGTGNDLYSSATQAEYAAGSAGVQFDNNTNIIVPNYRIINGDTYIDWCMRRAPGFFDVVCFTSNGSAGATFSHNLAAVPELLIVKSRGTTGDWYVFGRAVGSDASGQWYMKLNLTSALTGYAALTTNTSSSVTIANGTLNDTNATQVAYLFASVSGVSKVGTYTGTGALQTVNCGFTGGARFVLIKRTDSTGDWWVYDSARGITSGNDPYLFLNSSAAEVTGTNYVDTTSVGFQVTAAAPAGLNANGGTYLFLAVA
jgi:hypothetical protein